jgi:quinol monooxygenase YgiN
VSALAWFRQPAIVMIIATVTIQPPPDRRAAVLDVFQSVQGRVRAQPGCAACDIFEDQGPEPTVVLIERWVTEEALEAHLRSETYGWVLAAIELSGREPDVSYERVSASEGIELVERLRGPGPTTVGR